MAETEPNLPMDLPIPRPSWGQRIKAAFTHPIKLPGWLAVLIVVAQEIPDWKHRIDFWLEVAKGTGGYLAMAAAAIASPYFTPSLLVAGLGWIIFAGEAHKGVQRHHWLRYVGWSIVTTCLTLMVITVGYGALTFYIQQQVSQKDTELQNKYAQCGRSVILGISCHYSRLWNKYLVSEIPEPIRGEIPLLDHLIGKNSRSFAPLWSGSCGRIHASISNSPVLGRAAFEHHVMSKLPANSTSFGIGRDGTASRSGKIPRGPDRSL